MTFSAAGQGARVLGFFFVILFYFFHMQRTNPAFLFSHFPSEERAACLSGKKRRIQTPGLERGERYGIGK